MLATEIIKWCKSHEAKMEMAQAFQAYILRFIQRSKSSEAFQSSCLACLLMQLSKHHKSNVYKSFWYVNCFIVWRKVRNLEPYTVPIFDLNSIFQIPKGDENLWSQQVWIRNYLPFRTTAFCSSVKCPYVIICYTNIENRVLVCRKCMDYGIEKTKRIRILLKITEKIFRQQRGVH